MSLMLPSHSLSSSYVEPMHYGYGSGAVIAARPSFSASSILSRTMPPTQPPSWLHGYQAAQISRKASATSTSGDTFTGANRDGSYQVEPTSPLRPPQRPRPFSVRLSLSQGGRVLAIEHGGDREGVGRRDGRGVGRGRGGGQVAHVADLGPGTSLSPLEVTANGIFLSGRFVVTS